ncbi:hypothetical protein DFH05DRAFT_362653 [Lentinula detonsa]|uniref:Uncharacterized protein n=1 Tax=Lentinula detonsa TaxID=2804962 RepID=A0A9W8NTW4_9AGAR|nr:hypothetical protein DFH05DRAFT_362653 [Lentinula detonsa]
MRIIFIFNTLVLSVPVLFSNLAAARPCRTSSLVHNSELEDRGMAYPSPPPPSSPPPPKVPDGAICFFALNHETTQKLNLKSNKNFILKNSKMKAQIDYKFKCGSSPKVIDRKPKDLLVRIVLKTAKEQFQFPKQQLNYSIPRSTSRT